MKIYPHFYPPLIHYNRSKGFTLAELLISLAILGVIAMFTIPKVLQTQQNQHDTAVARETAAMVSAAYSAYRLNNMPSASTGFADLTPFMNYVRVDTTLLLDEDYNLSGTTDCSTASRTCLVLHNGGVLLYKPTAFGGTSTTNALWYELDPDGKVTQPGSPVFGQGKKSIFWLYFDGRLTHMTYCLAGTTTTWWLSPVCPGSLSPPYLTDWN